MPDQPEAPPALTSAVSPTEAAVEAATPRKLWQALLRVTLTLALLVGLYLFARHLNFRELWNALKRASPGVVALVIALNFLNNFMKSVYWEVALRRTVKVPVFRMFRLTLAGSVASLLAPARAGDAFKVWQLKKRFGADVPNSLVVMGLEKVADVLALLLCVAPLPFVMPGLPERLRQILYLIPLGLAVAVAVLAYASRHEKLAASRWFSGLTLLRSPRVVVQCGLAILAAWLLDLFQVRLLIGTVGGHPSAGGDFGAAMLVMLVVNLAVAIPVSPGNAGTHELGTAFALSMVGVPKIEAAAVALLYHGTQTLPLVLAGFYDARQLLAGKGSFGAERPSGPVAEPDGGQEPAALTTQPPPT